MNHRSLVLLCLGIWTSPVIGSAAGLQPANPYPPDAAINIPANADLTWTPGDMELIGNGGFELANFTGWVRVNEGGGGGGANNNTYINDGHRAAFLPGITNDPPVTGSYCAVTDQDGPGSATLYQDVFIPAAVRSVWLTWADQIHNFGNIFSSDPPPNTQEYRVEVRTTNNTALALCYRTEPDDPPWTGWNKRAFDLTPFQGQTVRIAFQETQWRNFFHMYYDNVSVRMRDTGPVTYDVFFGTNSVPGSNELLGTVSAGNFALPQLRPQQTYFWRVNTRLGSDVSTGAVWRFTTTAVGAFDHFNFGPIASPQAPGEAFNVSLTARDAAENVISSSAEAVNIAAYNVTAIATNNLLTDFTPEVLATYENATVGYSFTPDTDLIVVGFRAYSGGKVSLWTDDGVSLGTQLPVQLLANRTYRIGVFSPGVATNYLRFDGSSTFPHGTLNQAYQSVGDAMPNQPHPTRWWLVDMSYVVPTLGPTVLSQTVSLNGGIWNGVLTVPAPGIVQLKASDAGGHVGIASLISIADQLRLEIILDGGVLNLRFPTLNGYDYALQSSTTLAPNSWLPYGSSIPGTGNIVERPVTTNGRSFFRLKRTP